LAELMAVIRPDSVLFGDAGTLIDCTAPVPTWIETEPPRKSPANASADNVPVAEVVVVAPLE
jgi:hypothetical protein